MPENQDSLEQRARAIEEAEPNFRPDLDASTHAGQRPTTWVAVVLCTISVFSGAATFVALGWARAHRGLGEEVPHQALCPWNKLNKPVTAVTVEAGPNGAPGRLLVADAETLHDGSPVKDLYYWQRQAVKRLNPSLSDPTIVGLSAQAGHVAALYQQRGNPRRGVQLATLPEDLRRMTVWSRPAIDASFFPGITDETASCLLWDERSGYRFVGGPGVGAYNPLTRCWDRVLTQGHGDIDSPFVNDLEAVGDDVLVIAGTNGIDLGRWSAGDWTKTGHLNRSTGLAGDNVKILHKTEYGPAQRTANLTYVTAEHGLGWLRVQPANGAADGVQGLIGEGSAPGLTRQSLLRFGEDDVRGALWMMYRDPGNKGKLRAGLYQMAGHQMSGTAATDSWPESSSPTLAVDVYADKLTAWAGGDGLRRLRAAAPGSLEVADAGLNESIVQEIVPTTPGVFVKAKLKAADSPACLYAGMRERANVGRGNSWRYSIGPRRFPGLTTDDITAATDGMFEGRPALFFGTHDKGIGAFLRSSREMVQAFGPDAASVAQRVPVTGSLDLCAAGPRLVQVGSDRSLHFYNGSSWSTVIPAGGIQIKADQITTVVAQGPHLVVGSEQTIGHYDASTHRWRALPPIPGLRRLLVAIDRLWAIDSKQTLYSCPLGQTLTSSRAAGSLSSPAGPSPAGADPAGNPWVQEESFVVDLYGDERHVVAIAETGMSYRLWMKTSGNQEKRTIVETIPLPGDQQTWAAAAVEGTVLYVAPHGQGVGRYDLFTHQWTSLPLPAGAGAVGSMAVTRGGLWLLDSHGSLSCWTKGGNGWTQAADDVAHINAGHDVVMAVKTRGHVLMSDPFTGAVPMKTLVGEPLADSLANVQAGAVFKGRLFVATPTRVGWYEAQMHSWHTYEPNVAANVKEFAASDAYLYGRSGAGLLWRWTESGDKWEVVTAAAGSPLQVRQISGSQGPAVVALDTEGRLLVLSDSDPSHPTVALAASHCPISATPTAAAESGQDLLLASTDGAVAAYGRVPAQPWRWKPVVERGTPVDQILTRPEWSDRVVVVGGSRAVLLSKGRADGDWRVARAVMETDGRIRGDVSRTHFYGLVQKEVGDRLLLKTPLPIGVDPSTDPAPPPAVLIGDRFPASPQAATAAIGMDDKGRLYRADESGAVARYSFDAHTWTAEPIQRVGQFLRLDEQLWAWCPATSQLHHWLQDQWQKDSGNWTHVTGDGKSMVLADSRGQVVLRTTQGDRTLIPALAEDLPIKNTAEIMALAEQGNTLFLATSNGSLLSYDRAEHKWQQYPEAAGIARLEKMGGAPGALFAVTRAGILLRFDGTSQHWVAVLPDKRTAQAVVSAGDRLAVITDEGHALLLDAQGRVVADHRPGMIEGRGLTQFDLAAATEQDGQLLLLPRNDPRGNRLWAYDPQRHSWTVRDLDGTPDRFYASKDGVWAATRPKSDSLTMSRIVVTPQLQTSVSVSGLLDASSDGQTIIVVTADGRVRQLEADGRLTSLGIAESSLPDGRQIHDLLGVANACMALLDDGSVYHYTMQTRKWDRQIPPAASGKSGTIVNIGGRKAMLLVQSDVDIWSCDLTTAAWTKLKPGDIVPLPGSPSGLVPSDWEVAGQAPEYKLKVRVGQRLLSMELRNGRLGFDRATRVAWQSGMLSVSTPAGVRTFKPQQGRWIEEEAILADFSFSKLDPVVFEGQVFAMRRHPQGPFRAADGRSSMSLKIGAATSQILPASGPAGLGFAHDLIRDVAISGRQLLLATAGGVAAMTAEGTSLKMEALCESSSGLTDPNLVRILNGQGGPMVKSRSGACYAGSTDGRKWSPMERTQMDQALATVAAISRYNAMLTHWRVRQGAGGAELDAMMNAGAAAVSLSPRGFGFDCPKAFSFDDKRCKFYTPDGLAMIERTGAGGAFSELDPLYRLPPLTGFAEVLEPPSSQGDKRVWLRATATPDQAWHFDGQRWSSLSPGDYAKALFQWKPYYWDGADLRWDRSGQVTLRGKAANAKEITVSFDTARGRFDTDIAYDLAVFEDGPVVVTKGGIIRFNTAGGWDHVTPAGANGLAPAEGWRVRVVPVNGTAKLALQWPGGLWEWNSKWGPPADLAALKEAAAQVDAHLVLGNTWRIERAKAQSRPIPLQARIVSGGPFVDIKLRDDGVFDFERISSVLQARGTCHVASEFGLLQIAPAKGEITAMVRQNAPALSLGQLDGEIFARLASGETLSYEAQWQRYAGQDDVFAKIQQRLVKQSYWQWDRDGAQVRVQLLPGPTSPWAGSDTLLVNLKNGRFDFDAVYDAGYANCPWLVTDKGLLPRVGPDLRQIGPPEKVDNVGSTTTLIHLVHDGAPVLLLKAVSDLYWFSGKDWQSVPASKRKELEGSLVTQVAKGPHFEVRRSSGRLETLVQIGEPVDRYERVEFDNSKGLFKFDIFTAACPYAGDVNAVALLATEGGVAVYDLRPAGGGAQRAAGPLCHLYCDPEVDGLDPASATTVAYAPKKNLDFAVGRPDRLYQLEGANSSRSFGRWVPANESGRMAFDDSRRTIVDHADGWQVSGRTLSARSGFGSNRFDTRWRGQMVRLVDLRETHDAAESVCRFAHDVPLSATLVDGQLWVGTRGGVAVFTSGDPNRVDPTRFDIRGEQTLPPGELTGNPSPKGVGFIRAGRSDRLVYARRESDQAVLCCEAATAGREWRQVPTDNNGFASACRMVEDPIWTWEKNSVEPVKLRPRMECLHVPIDYRYLVNGTWAFLEVGHVGARDPRHTIAFFHDHLYLGTAGGVTRFPAAEELGRPSAGDARLRAEVYAVAAGRTGPVPLLDVMALHVDRQEDRLYAETPGGRCYAFDPSENTWSAWEGRDNPVDRALILVKNGLFHWRMMEGGTHQLNVLPLDIADQSSYPLFQDGRFAFDNVHEFTSEGDRLWTATDGGVCLYTYPEFRPLKFFAQAILEARPTGGATGRGNLPMVREVIRDPDKPARVLCRTVAQDVYLFENGSWKRGSDGGAFEKAYCRQTDSLTRWLEYPDRRLEVQATTTGPLVLLGTKGGRTKLNLFRNNRFSFDDIQGAVLDGSALLTATPIGVVEQRIDWDRQQAPMIALHCHAKDGTSWREMSDLEHITRCGRSAILAWGTGAFKGIVGQGTVPSRQWQPYEQPRERIGPEMIIEDDVEQWKLVACIDDKPMQAIRLRAGQTRAVAARFRCRDVSQAVADDRWLYVPIPEPKGGLLRIAKNDVVAQ